MLPRAVALVLALLLPQAAGQSKDAARVSAIADRARVEGRFDNAIAVYRQALEMDPDYLPARRGVGTVLDLTDHHAEARVEYLAALEGRRGSYDAAPVLSSLAVSYVFDRRFDEARAALQESIDLVVKRRGADPNDQMSFFDLAMAAGAFDEAERALTAHLSAHGVTGKPPVMPPSTAPDSRFIMPRLDWMRYSAQRAVIAARRARPADARRLMADAEAEAREIGDVLASFSKTTGTAVGLNPSRELALSQGELAFWLGDTGTAVRLLGSQDLFSPRHLLLLGQACEREHKRAEARAAYTRLMGNTTLSIELAWARPLAQERLAALGQE